MCYSIYFLCTQFLYDVKHAKKLNGWDIQIVHVDICLMNYGIHMNILLTIEVKSTPLTQGKHHDAKIHKDKVVTKR